MDQILLLLTLVLVVFIGILTSKMNIFEEKDSKIFNKFIFNISAPALFFLSTASIDLEEVSTFPKFIFVNSIFWVILYLLKFLILKRSVGDNKKIGAMLFSSSSGNVVYLGFPILLNVFSDAHLGLGVVYVLTVLLISDFLGIFLLEHLKSEKAKPDWGKIIKEFLVNPLVLASLVGGLFLISPFTLPGTVSSSLDMLGKTTTGLALFSLGIYFSNHFKVSEIKLSVVTSVIKVLIQPLMLIPLLLLFGISGAAFETSIIMTAMPAAVFTIVIADIYDLDKAITSNSIVLSTILFLLSFPGIVYILELMS